ncbi:MAG TPA: hypothetical protein VFE25_16310 [Opitutaceae bacterium]|jgi:hypothetical protein|nr:hypothetical protein [Opitutaceae bacterium]
MRTAFRCLTLLFLSALLPRGMLAGLYVRVQVGAHPGGPAESTPYLAALGCTPLRFREATVAPEVMERPAAAAPPQPHLTQAEASVSQANAAAVQPPPPKPPGEAPTVIATTSKAPTEADTDAEPASNQPISILPDTVRPQLQAEDFLPFFVIPDAAKPAVPVPSEPGKLPPSTATYTEK